MPLASVRGLILLCALAVLGGCASLQPSPPDPGAVGATQTWSGRFALTATRADRPGEPEQASGRFQLLRQGVRTELELYSPLGATLARAIADSRGARLSTADGKEFSAATPEALTEQVFGWRIPIDRLPRWVQGKIERVTQAGDAPNNRQPAAGTEAGWQVRFEQWEANYARRVTLEFPERVTVRLLIDAVTP